MAQTIDLLKNTSFENKMDALIEAILKGENYDYTQLTNKPSINGYTLEGNKTNAQLGIPTKLSELDNDSDFVEDKNYVHTDNNYTNVEKTSVGTIKDKVDKVNGKGLSTNDLTNELKSDYDDAVLKSHEHNNKNILDGITNDSISKWNSAVQSVKIGQTEYKTGTNVVLPSYPTTLPASDVYSWAKEPTKPTYTKSDVGLANVPNVTTNNQVPTFTQATERKNIASGEAITTLFGKIMKWFTDLKTVAFTGSYTDLSDKPTTFVKSGSGAKSGLVPTPPTTAGTTKYLREDGTWEQPPTGSSYTLPTASSTVLGGIKVGSSLNITNGVLNLTWNE